jgi:hypothetical protein
MGERRRYNEELRSIGQALEAAGVTDCELYNVPTGYFIKDLRVNRSSFYSGILRWVGRKAHEKFATYGFEFEEIEQLSLKGRARRSEPGQLTQFRTLSNILRTIGAYLDLLQAELIELHKRPISITLAYRDRTGQEYREERPISSFYEFFRELFEKRGQPEQRFI